MNSKVGVRENRVENDTLFLGEANKEQPLYVKLGGFSSILRKCLDGECEVIPIGKTFFFDWLFD